MMLKDSRTKEVLLRIIECYLESGTAVGSRTLSKEMSLEWSPATLRNIMADLEELGLLSALHRSSGRLPTSKALQIYVHQLLEHSHQLPESIQEKLEDQFEEAQPFYPLLKNLVSTLSELSGCTSLVVIPPQSPLIHSIDFLHIHQDKALCVVVTQCGQVQHHMIPLPKGMDAHDLRQASDYLNSRISGYSMMHAEKILSDALGSQQEYLKKLISPLIDKGFDLSYNKGEILIQDQHKLLENIESIETLQAFKALSEWLATQEKFQELFKHVASSGQIQVFLGSEESLFNLEGWSFVMAPFDQKKGHLKAGLGFIGSATMDYRRIIPLLESSIKLIERTFV